MKQKLLLNWIWHWIWLRVRVWFRVRFRGFFSNCDVYRFFHDFHLFIHFFYCLPKLEYVSKGICILVRLPSGFLFSSFSISSCYRSFYFLSKNWLHQSPLIPSTHFLEVFEVFCISTEDFKNL